MGYDGSVELASSRGGDEHVQLDELRRIFYDVVLSCDKDKMVVGIRRFD